MRLSELESRVTIEVLAEVALADGRIDPRELRALWAAQAYFGVASDWVDHLLDGALSRPPLRWMSPSARRAAYAASVWLTLVDGVLAPRERRLLCELRADLGLRPEEAAGIEDRVWAWMSRGGGDLRASLSAALEEPAAACERAHP